MKHIELLLKEKLTSSDIDILFNEDFNIESNVFLTRISCYITKELKLSKQSLLKKKTIHQHAKFMNSKLKQITNILVTMKIKDFFKIIHDSKYDKGSCISIYNYMMNISMKRDPESVSQVGGLMKIKKIRGIEQFQQEAKFVGIIGLFKFFELLTTKDKQRFTLIIKDFHKSLQLLCTRKNKNSNQCLSYLVNESIVQLFQNIILCEFVKKRDIKHYDIDDIMRAS